MMEYYGDGALALLFYFQIAMSGWANSYSYRCQPVDYTDNPLAIRVSCVHENYPSTYFLNSPCPCFSPHFRTPFPRHPTLHTQTHNFFPASLNISHCSNNSTFFVGFSSKTFLIFFWYSFQYSLQYFFFL